MLPLTLPLLLAATSTHAEIFKCIGHGNVPTYQNFPCEFDSLGAWPSRMRGGKASVAKPVPTSLTEASPAIPLVGMHVDDVRRIWGDPITSSKEEYTRTDIEIWTYADSRSIAFDREGRVAAIHW
jgi:hypothetical protein